MGKNFRKTLAERIQNPEFHAECVGNGTLCKLIGTL